MRSSSTLPPTVSPDPLGRQVSDWSEPITPLTSLYWVSRGM
jgi:hypothetical protein